MTQRRVDSKNNSSERFDQGKQRRISKLFLQEEKPTVKQRMKEYGKTEKNLETWNYLVNRRHKCLNSVKKKLTE